MFLLRAHTTHCTHSFPRIRGDVPNVRNTCGLIRGFSPHTRGCSIHAPEARTSAGVFPAYAGMFRLLPRPSSSLMSFPRIRGDVPCLFIRQYRSGSFSPHTRGCSDVLEFFVVVESVFPAYAGMFSMVLPPQLGGKRFPRIRGDVPMFQGQYGQGGMFSPHTRGCSLCHWVCGEQYGVFPAYAGMFPKSQPPCLPKPFSTHTRGYSRGKACNEEDSSEII